MDESLSLHSQSGASQADATGPDRASWLDELIKLEKEAERQAYAEEWDKRRRVIVTDHTRAHRRGLELEAVLAPKMLSQEALSSWRDFRSVQLDAAAFRRTARVERRLAPEAAHFEDRMDLVLLKHANVPLGQLGKFTINTYYKVLEVAADSVEQVAYPGTIEARKRYVLALRRCARELRDPHNNSEKAMGRALQRALGTLQLSLTDGTLNLWHSPQSLVDDVGLKSDGTSQDVDLVSEPAWWFIWNYAVSSRLRRECAERFIDVPDNRAFRADEQGRLLDDGGHPLTWRWDGYGSGELCGKASINGDADNARKKLMEETGLDRVLARPDWVEHYEESSEHHAFKSKMAILDRGTTSIVCDALADILERPLLGKFARLVSPISWDHMDDEEFERLIYSVVSAAPAYSSVAWLTDTRAADRGRDLSAIRTVEDILNGPRQEFVIFQCKHWRGASIGLRELGKLELQMRLQSNEIDELVIVTSGRFSSDAVQYIENHNRDRKQPRIMMWPNSHLEKLVSCP